MPIIQIERATKDYGGDRGVFDLTFAVSQGEAVGFLGANGAGKSVTMRMLMGFVRPQAGRVSIKSLDCFEQRARIQRSVGYLPGELAFSDGMTGADFLRFSASMKGLGHRSGTGSPRYGTDRADELVDYFKLNPKAPLRSMSKGTRQKVGIVAAFMGSPEVLLLDEPTSGLDLLMQRRFVELIQAEKARGTTILLSSHLLGEVEGICDRAVFIRRGRKVNEMPSGQITLQGVLEELYGPEALQRRWVEPSNGQPTPAMKENGAASW